MPASQDAIPVLHRWLDEDRSSPSELTRGLLNALDRPAAPSITPSTFGTVLTGLLTAGAFPAVSLPRMWRGTMRWHHNILWHLAEWMSVNVGPAEAARLHEAAAPGPAACLNKLAIAVAVSAVIVAGLGIAQGEPLSAFWLNGPDLAQGIFPVVFFWGITTAFVLLWISTSLHLRHLHRARTVLDEITPYLAPTAGLRVPAWEWGIRPVPLILGGLLALSGLFWALPMLIAATAQRRALLVHHRRIRAQFAHRVRDLLDTRRPIVPLPPVIDRTGICRNAVCDQAVPPDGRFCPRCGTPQRPLSQIME